MINNVYCAATTPFDDKYQIDFDGFDKNIDHYVASGLGGILVCGGTGEFVSLDKNERIQLVEHASKTISGRTGFMVGCSSETTADAINYAKHAESVGANSLLLIASYYFKPSEEELLAHFKAVADSVKIPIIIYNNPGSCGTNLSANQVKQLSKIDNINHIKEAAGDLHQFRQIRDACDKDFNMMAGCDSLAFEELRNGAKGWISITANALSTQSQLIFSKCMAGDYDSAWEMYQKYLPVYSICESSYKAIQTIKYIMDKLGYCGGASRPPRLALLDIDKHNIDELLIKAALI